MNRMTDVRRTDDGQTTTDNDDDGGAALRRVSQTMGKVVAFSND